jgi:hypothetical protein
VALIYSPVKVGEQPGQVTVQVSKPVGLDRALGHLEADQRVQRDGATGLGLAFFDAAARKGR